MKGLLLKDLYMLRSYCRTVLIVAILFVAVFALTGSEEISFYLMLPCMLAGILPMTLLSYDEREKWDVCVTMLPVTKTQIVTEKYLLVPLLLIPVSLLSLGAILLRRSGSFAGGTGLLTIAVTAGLLAPAIVLPFAFGLGVEKGRLAYYATFAVLFALGGVLTSGNTGLRPPAVLSSPAVLPLIALALLALSWRLSAALYQKRKEG